MTQSREERYCCQSTVRFEKLEAVCRGNPSRLDVLLTVLQASLRSPTRAGLAVENM